MLPRSREGYLEKPAESSFKESAGGLQAKINLDLIHRLFEQLTKLDVGKSLAILLEQIAIIAQTNGLVKKNIDEWHSEHCCAAKNQEKKLDDCINKLDILLERHNDEFVLKNKVDECISKLNRLHDDIDLLKNNNYSTPSENISKNKLDECVSKLNKLNDDMNLLKNNNCTTPNENTSENKLDECVSKLDKLNEDIVALKKKRERSNISNTMINDLLETIKNNTEKVDKILTILNSSEITDD